MVKIESGLGEKLNHLDETYKGIRESFDNRFTVKDAKKELKEEEQEVKKILKDKGDLVNELID